jgi:hypothetical protein
VKGERERERAREREREKAGSPIESPFELSGEKDSS